ncbi:hypothetical protein B4119_2371 [Parageobacillus caldoxylosilyticus]|uniref:Uncharacterized protein n=1 Tax=Saccharococcus caldoxylosilyticus TaxID=81408 RepID=A0A150LV97_9BACL|nr:hypothetical protein B4119_2371 [Parageobacillus caldoxylosilyticus]
MESDIPFFAYLVTAFPLYTGICCYLRKELLKIIKTPDPKRIPLFIIHEKNY